MAALLDLNTDTTELPLLPSMQDVAVTVPDSLAYNLNVTKQIRRMRRKQSRSHLMLLLERFFHSTHSLSKVGHAIVAGPCPCSIKCNGNMPFVSIERKSTPCA